MECVGLLFAVIIGVLIYIALRNQPETRAPQPPEQPSGSPLNGLFALFLFDRWLDGGSRGLFGDPGEKQDAFDEDGQDDWEDREDEDDYWDNQAGF